MSYHSSNEQIDIFKIPVPSTSYLTLCKYEIYSLFLIHIYLLMEAQKSVIHILKYEPRSVCERVQQPR